MGLDRRLAQSRSNSDPRVALNVSELARITNRAARGMALALHSFNKSRTACGSSEREGVNMNSKSALSWLGLCGVLMCGAACGGENAAGDGSASDSALASQDEALRHHHHSSAPATTASASATPVASASANTSVAAPVSDVATLIAAAQTPDGMAIPQAAGPGGQCPPVLVALGFWACPILDQTCSFDANGATHSCVCDRTQGEGQTPSWVCN